MKRSRTGQSVVEYALLFGLLLIVVVSILVITGPGIGNVYSQVMASGRNDHTAASVTTPAAEIGTSASGTKCGSITILGDVRFTDPDSDESNGAGKLLLGGKSNCSLVVDSGAGMADSLVFDPMKSPPSILCVGIDDFVVVDEFLEDVTRTYFSLESTSVGLRITDGAGGSALFTASLQPDHLVVEKNAIIVRGDAAGMSVDNGIDSPTLGAFDGAERATFRMVIRTRNMEEAASQADFTLDRSSLRDRSGIFRLELIAECN